VEGSASTQQSVEWGETLNKMKIEEDMKHFSAISIFWFLKHLF